MEGNTFSNHSLKFLLITILALINFSSAGRQIAPKTSTEFIKTSCSSTAYPKLCFETLSTHATLIQTNPRILAHAALNVTLSTAKSTSATMVTLSKTHGLKPIEVESMQDCVEQIGDTIAELRNSIGEMSKIESSNFGVIVNDIQTWVSAALTEENTCSDGFQGNGMNVKVKTTVRSMILTIAHLTSNALALVNNYASVHGY